MLRRVLEVNSKSQTQNEKHFSWPIIHDGFTFFRCIILLPFMIWVAKEMAELSGLEFWIHVLTKFQVINITLHPQRFVMVDTLRGENFNECSRPCQWKLSNKNWISKSKVQAGKTGPCLGEEGWKELTDYVTPSPMLRFSSKWDLQKRFNNSVHEQTQPKFCSSSQIKNPGYTTEEIFSCLWTHSLGRPNNKECNKAQNLGRRMKFHQKQNITVQKV